MIILQVPCVFDEVKGFGTKKQKMNFKYLGDSLNFSATL